MQSFPSYHTQFLQTQPSTDTSKLTFFCGLGWSLALGIGISSPKKPSSLPGESSLCSCVHAQLLSCVRPLQCHRLWPVRLLCPWDFPSKHTEVGCHFLLQGIFLTQGSNRVSFTGRRILYPWATWEVHGLLQKCKGVGSSFPSDNFYSRAWSAWLGNNDP